MNKTDFIKEVAYNAASSQVDAERLIDTVIEELMKALVKGETVQFKGFGSFSVSTRSSHKGRNPRTGEAITIPETKYVCFKQGNLLKAKINE